MAGTIGTIQLWRDRADLDELAKTTLRQRHIQRTNTMVMLSTVAEGALVGLA